MKIKSISGFVCYVKDLDITADFYEKLGFRIGKRSDFSMTVYINWFWVDFVSAKAEDRPGFASEAGSAHKGEGVYVAINVEGVDEFHKGLVELGLTPSSEPRDWPWGRREFVLRDPDGYKLVFFQKI